MAEFRAGDGNNRFLNMAHYSYFLGWPGHEHTQEKNEHNHDNRKRNMDKIKISRDGFYGWLGYGGSVFQWEPQLKVNLNDFGHWPDFTMFDVICLKRILLWDGFACCVL